MQENIFGVAEELVPEECQSIDACTMNKRFPGLVHIYLHDFTYTRSQSIRKIMSDGIVNYSFNQEYTF
jgi:hypothetical protein